MWALIHQDGTVVAMLRFKPKRKKVKVENESYYMWTDCNGTSPIEGSMNAKCRLVKSTITFRD